MGAVRAIPQEYGGIEFRSRTEARWAEFFRLTATPFEYEPEGYDLAGTWYVPDFYLPHAKLFLEVKGSAPTMKELRLAQKLAEASKEPVLIVTGNPNPERVARILWPDRGAQNCYFVEEHKGVGAWLAQLADGGGWAIALKASLVNCAAYGAQHELLQVAGRLQFNKPEWAERDPYFWAKRVGEFEPIAAPALRVLHRVRHLKNGASHE